MKKVFVVLSSASLVLAIGCRDYDFRLENTLEEKKYEKRLDDNLEPAPTQGLLQGDLIFVRPPLGLGAKPTEAFGMPVTDTGKFDIENSFIDQKKGTSLHVVARVKKQKPPSAKKTAAPVETTARGKFIDDIVELVKAAYSIELAPAEFKPEPHSHKNRVNDYKAVRKDLTTKEVEVYVFSEPSGVHEVALIFEFPKDQKNFISPKIGLSLESFAVEGGGEIAAPSAPPPI
jgi:hypothetical protein